MAGNTKLPRQFLNRMFRYSHAPMSELFTIGHSTHTAEKFLELLRQHKIEAIGDVRSSPFSAWTPQFNRPALDPALRRPGVQYVFLADHRGARRVEREVYIDG